MIKFYDVITQSLAKLIFAQYEYFKMISLTPVFVPQMGSLGTGIYQMFHKYKLFLPLSDVA